MEFLYIYQEHYGQASAINTGLLYVGGEYFMWIDCDDFLEMIMWKKDQVSGRTQ